MRVLFKLVWHGAAVVGLAVVAGAVWFWSQGITTRTSPSDAEIRVARSARSLMIPASAKSRTSPESATAETVRAGMTHFADHCASCHGNDGRGETEMGRGLFPRAPDMRQSATQQLTDGELFYIIENGVKMTGMPAWGTGQADGEAASWHLVHFIRKLPTLTEGELDEMTELNPRSPEEWKALEEERRFLAGDDPAQPAPAPPGHVHKP